MKKLILLIIFLAGCAAAPDKELIVLQVDMELLKKQIDTLQTDLRIEQEKLVILSCESKFRHDGIWGDNGRSYGIAQFQKPTFDELKTRAGKTTLQWTKQEDQLWLLDWALRNGYAKKWSCSTANKGR
jgi:hypothetical protein